MYSGGARGGQGRARGGARCPIEHASPPSEDEELFSQSFSAVIAYIAT